MTTSARGGYNDERFSELTRRGRADVATNELAKLASEIERQAPPGRFVRYGGVRTPAVSGLGAF
jgi:hypothetical protein